MAPLPLYASVPFQICHSCATVAAVAFAGMLVVIMRSDAVRGILEDLVRRALTVE
ncbi:DUF4244 domain-containing protein [Microbacterium caowuchunii]|uniref:DUF4244 domain-containing protein n=1 Tax=Microbacterium caowuchunii TaxID=2614638 RepID=A0A5N0T8V6_9MICO|nr:DUF4244 domain-containing protein [Microbacterium caowuchunii]